MLRLPWLLRCTLLVLPSAWSANVQVYKGVRYALLHSCPGVSKNAELTHTRVQRISCTGRYALPPTGARRFLPAVQAPFEPGASHTAFGHDCIQDGRAGKISEDCLFLNIWKPTRAGERLLPVMLWVHGGGYSFGAGRDYDGSVLADSQGVVVITMNYRLGALGFFSSEQLLRETSAHTATATTGGMNGVLDVVVALQWLHRHVGHFGGDASQITLFGQSAGALSICTLLVSPKAKGLFRRAILESGPCTGPWTPGTEDEVLALSATFAAGRSLAALRQANASDLFAQGPQVLPGVDRWVLPHGGGLPREHFKRLIEEGGRLNAEEIMLGANSFDGIETFVINGGPPLGPLAFAADMATSFPANSSVIEQIYPPTTRFGGSRNGALVQATGDCTVVCPNYDLASMISATGSPSFMYFFRYGPVCQDEAVLRNISTAPITEGWASHAAELYWSFGTPANCITNASERALTAAMQNYWGSFARVGRPMSDLPTGTPRTGGIGRVEWTQYDPNARNTLILDLDIRMQHAWKAKDCAALKAAAGTGPESWPCLLS